MPAKISDLFPALVECFTIILCGYISGRTSIVTPKQAVGLGQFVGKFALPALLLKNMVELDFSTVSWSFMIAVLLGKASVFVCVLVLSCVLLRGRRLARGALYAIFATQSNDFALGYPLVSALYGESHPEFLQYIYLLAPISLLILNPIGFVILEIDKLNNSQGPEYVPLRERLYNDEKVHFGESVDVIEEDDVEDSPVEGDSQRNGWRACGDVLKGVLLNPLVFMVFAGLAGHFVFHGHLPPIIKNTLSTLASAFAGTALFFLGLTMVGKISKQKGMELLVPALLIIAKVVILPLLIRQFCASLTSVIPSNHAFVNITTNSTENYDRSLSDFGYLYGTFPSAPTVVIYATQYGLETDRLAAGMVLCTSLSAPVMYISAWTLTMSSMSSEYFEKDVVNVGKDTSIVTLLCAVWCVIVFVVGGKFKRVPHAVTLAYMFSLVISSLGSILWDGIAARSNHAERLFIFGMMYFGVKCSRLYVPSMAVALVMILWKGQRAVWNQCFVFIIFPIVTAFVVTVSLMTAASMHDISSDGVFMYGRTQDIVSLVVLLTSFVITVACLIIVAKIPDFHDRTLSSSSSLLSRTTSEYSSDDDDSPYRRNNGVIFCCIHKRCVLADIQKGRHIILLILLTLSIFVGICLVSWRLFGSADASVYYEMAFLDCVFNFGQGVFVFILFGLDTDLIIDPIIRLYRKIRYGSESISLPELNSIKQPVLLQCLQFIRHHLDDCKLDIVATHKSGLNTYENVFTGVAFCDWIIDRGLVNDRTEAEIYGNNLLIGRVLHHVTHRHYFYDRHYLYMFEEPKTCHKITRPASPMSADDSEGTSHDPNTPIIIVSPLKRPYFGYSFEAYLSDTEIPASLRKQRMRQSFSPKSSSQKQFGSAKVKGASNKNVLKKMFPNEATHSEFSDSSVDGF